MTTPTTYLVVLDQEGHRFGSLSPLLCVLPVCGGSLWGGWKSDLLRVLVACCLPGEVWEGKRGEHISPLRLCSGVRIFCVVVFEVGFFGGGLSVLSELLFKFVNLFS